MPYGKWPDRVKAFRRWAAERIDKANINDSVTSTSSTRRRRKPSRRKKRRLKREEE